MSIPGDRAPTLDWGVGRYEATAAQLLPTAHAVVERAAPRPGEQLVDLGCGTGNAALLAAGCGATVTGVDPAARLLEVARRRAAEQGLEAKFALGEAAALPLGDGEADVIVSVFAVIFAPDPGAAAAEIGRVARAQGRVVLSAWLPTGAISAAARIVREAIARAVRSPAVTTPFAWHDRDALSALFAPHGFDVAVLERELAFTASSAAAYLDGEFHNHPLWLSGRAALELRGEADAVSSEVLAILEAANEDRGAFRVTSRYVIATARRGGRG